MVHTYDCSPEDWQRFIGVMNSGQRFECDEEMFYYWLEVLPPVYVNRQVELPEGQTLRATFGFAEGEEPITAFWCEDGRYFGQQTTAVNSPAFTL